MCIHARGVDVPAWLVQEELARRRVEVMASICVFTFAGHVGLANDSVALAFLALPFSLSFAFA